VPYVILIGAEEMAQGTFVVKDMGKGSQTTYSLDRPEEFLKLL
jgi:histidyl-tRNA synthetase